MFSCCRLCDLGHNSKIVAWWRLRIYCQLILLVFRYWAVAVPTYCMVIIVLGLAFYIGLNFMTTPSPTSLNKFFGKLSSGFHIKNLLKCLPAHIEYNIVWWFALEMNTAEIHKSTRNWMKMMIGQLNSSRILTSIKLTSSCLEIWNDYFIFWYQGTICGLKYAHIEYNIVGFFGCLDLFKASVWPRSGINSTYRYALVCLYCLY